MRMNRLVKYGIVGKEMSFYGGMANEYTYWSKKKIKLLIQFYYQGTRFVLNILLKHF